MPGCSAGNYSQIAAVPIGSSEKQDGIFSGHAASRLVIDAPGFVNPSDGNMRLNYVQEHILIDAGIFWD